MNPEEEIVITGVSGRFPECENFQEFQEALFQGIDLITEDGSRYPPGLWGLPTRLGKIRNIDKFDAGYFGIHAKQADFMDPRQRILNETVYEAIVDAGYNPHEFKGSKTGVYVGITSFNSIEAVRERKSDGYSNIGLSLAMAANRVSYSFDLKGPSFSLDTACSSSMYCFVNAINDIKLGNTESALVCGAAITLHPHESLEFLNLNMLSRDGKCKVFSKHRNGYVRSDSIVAVLLQKRKKSRRVYATVLGGKANADGFKNEGITYPSTIDQLTLMKDVLKETTLDPSDITYVEAHGTGTQVGDIQECGAITKMYCQKKREPLLIGAVKSNMGHSEMAAGLCSLAKTLVAMETGIIPANLHVEDLDTTLPGLSDNKLQVVTENTKWDGGVAGINSFGFGGANAHILLRSNRQDKKNDEYPTHTHRLVQVSGRTEEAVNYFLDGIEENKDDTEFLALVDEMHKINFKGHNYRGYTILGENAERKVEKFSSNRPIWFIYAGMGSQWHGMGKDFMRLNVFRDTIMRCAEAVKPYNVDLLDLITNSTPATFNDISNCFCAIGAVEIALTDVLTSLGIVPDGIAGHSLGEVGCSYADGNITVEQAMLLVYARAHGSKIASRKPGQMAAVGLSKEECQKLLPDDVFIACQNSSSSVTISGPAESTKAVVEKLSAQNIFTRLVPSGGIAFHTKYIEEAGLILLDFVKKVIDDPKPRSPKWISTSVPPHKKDLEWAKLNGPEYHYNNFTSTVLFDQVFEHIPDDAIVIEVAPHGLLQAILKRETDSSTTHITLANRSIQDNEKFLLSAIGKIFTSGGQPNLRELYPEVKFPVSRGTTKISPFVKWDHSNSWFVPYWQNKEHFGDAVEVDVSEEKYSYLYGHNIDGRVLMPATGYLELVWGVFATRQLIKMEELPVIFENVKFLRATVLPLDGPVELFVNITRQSGNFEVFEGGSVVVTGQIYRPKDVNKEFTTQADPVIEKDNYLLMKREDLYKECHLRRYNYQGLFQGVLECDVHGTYGRLSWQNNFTSFLDTMMHLAIIHDQSRDLQLPTFIQQLTIDPVEHLRIAREYNAVTVINNKYTNVIRAGGVEMIGLETSKAPRRVNVQNEPTLERYDFVSYESSEQNQYDEDTSLRIALQIVLQNLPGLIKSLKACEVITSAQETKLTPTLKEILDKQPIVDADLICAEPSNFQNAFDLITLTEEVIPNLDISLISKSLTREGFILFKGNFSVLPTTDLGIVFQSVMNNAGIYLLRPIGQLPQKYAVVQVSISDFDWLEKVKSYMEIPEAMTVYLVSSEEINGLVGLLKSVLTEPHTTKFRVVVVDEKASKFNIDLPIYRDQLRNDLTVNILRNGHWGTYVFLPMEHIESKEVENAAIYIDIPGDLSTITWIERPKDLVEFHPKSETAYVFYMALNFKDIMIATAKLASSKMVIGFEYSGVTEAGRRVMGMLPETMSLQIRTDPSFTWEVPNSWTLEEAATVPCVYSTCYYAMLIRGRMQKGESILIHAGTGGIGMAAINIALSMDCTVFTTVSTQEKRDFLKKMFPELNIINIGNSRNKSFETMIMNNTKGKGVNLVLNSLAADLFQTSLRCVAQRGRFLEIGKVDFSQGSPINSKIFLKNCSLHGVFLDDLFGYENSSTLEIHRLLADGIKRGVVKPLPATVFDEFQVENAFRFLSTGKHKGKVLVQFRKEEPQSIKSPARRISAVPKVYFDSRKSYVLIGGLGGFGLELADWMISRGATKLVLNSRSGISNGYQSYCLKKWTHLNTTISIHVNSDDTTNLRGAEALIRDAQTLGPVGGVFNMALVLMDGLLNNQNKTSYEAVFNPKIVSALNMDIVTRKQCPGMDHFVVFSSVASGRGNAGQTNYAMANSAMETLCEKRRSDQLPGLAVQWGPIGDVGALALINLEKKVFEYMLPQSITSCLNTLERFMLQNAVIGSSIVLTEKSNMSSAKLSKSPAETVAHILGIKNLDIIDKSVSLMELGLDSLMIAEIKQALYRNFQLDYDVEALKELTMNDLIAKGDSERSADTSTDTKVTNVTESTNSPEVLVSKDVVVALRAMENSRTPIFLVHPIQGNVDLLRPLASKLKTAVYGLQCTKDINYDNMQDYAGHFVREVKKLQPKGPYCLCGYSFGACVALEMGLQMEKQNERVSLITIDGAPEYVKVALESAFVRVNKSVNKSRAAILLNFGAYFHQANLDVVGEELFTTEDWNEQVKIASTTLSKQTSLPQTEVAISAQLYYNRVFCGYFYQPSGILKGKVLLIRRDDNPYQLPDDYFLQKVCQQELDVVKIHGDHQTILKGNNLSEVAKAINSHFIEL